MHFFFVKKDGLYYYLCDDGVGIREIYSAQHLSFLIDTRLGTLYKHGDRDFVESHFDDLCRADFPVVIMTSNEWSIDEINKFINNAGYVLRYYNREYGSLAGLDV